MDFCKHKNEVDQEGFSIINNIYSAEEVKQIIKLIETTDQEKETFRKSANLFAIRQFLKEIPEVSDLVFNQKLKSVIQNIFGTDYFVVKSIYFDKPGGSNWFVAYHQDLTISVKEKHETPGFGPWTVKQQQFAVQPPLSTLENIYTVRIHLDDTTTENGALNVIPQSHLKGIYRPETINWQIEREVSCSVNTGGVMLMKPLLLHSSARTTNQNQRRVIHIEFSSIKLPDGLEWSETV